MVGYGVGRGIRLIRRGPGRIQHAVGACIILFVFLAYGNYCVSFFVLGDEFDMRRRPPIVDIINAERSFQVARLRDENKNGIGEYGTLNQLLWHNPRMVLSRHYAHSVILSGDPVHDEREFFAYAVPVNQGWPPIWPGYSLVHVFRSSAPFYRYSYASDETGIVRRSDRHRLGAVSRENAMNWEFVREVKEQ
jgi:hypothetical protein